MRSLNAVPSQDSSKSIDDKSFSNMGKHGVWDSEAVMILWVSCYFSSQLYFLVVFINCISQLYSSTIFLNCCIWNYGCPVKRLLPDMSPHPEDGQAYCQNHPNLDLCHRLWQAFKSYFCQHTTVPCVYACPSSGWGDMSGRSLLTGHP